MDLGPQLFSEEQLATRVGELAGKIAADYEGRRPLFVCILRGAVIFLADLCRQIPYPVEIDFMAVSSYGSATKTSGVVRILKDLEADVRDRHVLIVEDIVDSGLTLSYLLKNLESRRPASLEVCALLSKEGKKRVPIEIKYLGFTIPDIFVVGYGLDCSQEYRNLPSVASVDERECSA